jgi:hypothetical protein
VALDDTPTARYGPCVEGAGKHHNPTPGPAGAKFLYGHVWVTLAALAQHPSRGTIALPLLGSLYVRAKDVPGIPPERHWQFRTKRELAGEQLRWLKHWGAGRFASRVAIVDGGYAKKPFLKRAQAEGFEVISRLRKDAALWSVPSGVRRPGQRGPLPTYGQERIDLAIRAGQKRGWQTVECVQYRQRVVKTYKTFLATWRPAGGLIRVVLVKEEDGWIPLFSTNPEATVEEILEGAADRGSEEATFKDEKEVGGGRAAATAQPRRQRRGVQPELLDVQPDGGMGLGTTGRGVGGPQSVPVGRRQPTAFACGQAQGVAASDATAGNRRGSSGGARAGEDSGAGRAVVGPGRRRAQPEAEPTSACLRAGGWSQVQTPPLPQLASRNLRDVLYVDYDTIEKVTESTVNHITSLIIPTLLPLKRFSPSATCT